MRSQWCSCLWAAQSSLSPPHVFQHQGSSRSPLGDAAASGLSCGHRSSEEQLRYPNIPFYPGSITGIKEARGVPAASRAPALAAQRVTAGSRPLLPGATGMEGPVCPALGPPSSCASSSSSSSSSPCGAGPSVSSHPAPQGEHPSPRGLQAVLSDRPGTGRR